MHDWPLQGICSASYIEGDRVWFVSSRGLVVCADLDGYYDGTDDGDVVGDDFNVGDEYSKYIIMVQI